MAWPARLDCDRRKPFSSRLLSWRKNQKITCFIVVIVHGMDLAHLSSFCELHDSPKQDEKVFKKGGK
ncbi:hypothetical protein AWF80_028085 [Escherichia coli]|nr:hypothetical protein AWF80_028085 [Escherichia coli]TRY36549.1 hypothetical protein FNJ78_26065 [Escherichia coli]